MNEYSILSPFKIPASLKDRKVENIGDAFIHNALERSFGLFSKDRIISPRIPLTSDQVDLLKSSKAIIIGGANQLNDNYTIWPGLDANLICDLNIPLFPAAVGIHGEPGKCDRMSENTKEILSVIHEKIEFSSWRCPRTVDYLAKECPALRPKLLMTGCPVLYGKKLLKGKKFVTKSRRIAVSVTERGDFWDREVSILDYVSSEYPRSEKILVLHQNYSPGSRFTYFKYKWLADNEKKLNVYQEFRRYAVSRGFKVFENNDPGKFINLYKNIDMHYGSRLHAHLLCLSFAIPSWLVPVDQRSSGFSEYFGFPLCDSSELNRYQDFDFSRIYETAASGFSNYQKFVNSVMQLSSKNSIKYRWVK